MLSFGFYFAVAYASSVGAIGEDDGDGLSGPVVSFSGEDIFCVEVADDFAGASCIEVFAKDDADDFGFAVVDDEWFFVFAASSVAVGCGAGAVSALLYGGQLAAFDLCTVCEANGGILRFTFESS